jgi:hypothetical protein
MSFIFTFLHYGVSNNSVILWICLYIVLKFKHMVSMLIMHVMINTKITQRRGLLFHQRLQGKEF